MGKRKGTTRKLLMVILLIAVIVAFSIFVFTGENVSEMIKALASADYHMVMLALCVYIFGILCWSARWRYTLSRVGYRIPLRHVFQVVLSGIFVNNMTPMTYAGGDPIARTILMSRTTKVPASHASATIVSELLLDIPLFAFLLLFGIFASFLHAQLEMLALLIGSWIFVILLFVLGISAFLKRRMVARKFVGLFVRILKFFRRKPQRKKIEESVERFYRGGTLIFSRLRVAMFVTLISSFLWALGIIRLWVVFCAVGYSPQLPMLMLALTLPAIAGLIPLLPGGIGTVDITILSIFLTFGVPKGMAISALLIDRSISLIFGTSIGAIAISKLGIKVWRGEKITA
ncbi:MAG: lysylphosphatidylglycerol synthase transmembrane domain-containing protein [Candidatus Hadarchaeales archaeon]